MAEADKVVVVVTDDSDLREDTVYSFPPGFEVLVADDARHALRIMSERQPALAIVDIQTGSAGGFNLAREMNQVGNLADVPVLMLIERPQDSWLAGESGAAQMEDQAGPRRRPRSRSTGPPAFLI